MGGGAEHPFVIDLLQGQLSIRTHFPRYSLVPRGADFDDETLEDSGQARTATPFQISILVNESAFSRVRGLSCEH